MQRSQRRHFKQTYWDTTGKWISNCVETARNNTIQGRGKQRAATGGGALQAVQRERVNTRAVAYTEWNRARKAVTHRSKDGQCL